MPRQSLNGVRTHVIITKVQDRDLRDLSQKTGLTVAEHIRRAIDQYCSTVMVGLRRRVTPEDVQ